jgi:hypothetical protein
LIKLLPFVNNNMDYLSTQQHYEGDVEDLCLDFTVTEELGGKRIVHELRPGGKNISVMDENKLNYVHAMADFKLNRQVHVIINVCYDLQSLCSVSVSSLFYFSIFLADISICKCLLSRTHRSHFTILAESV